MGERTPCLACDGTEHHALADARWNRIAFESLAGAVSYRESNDGD